MPYSSTIVARSFGVRLVCVCCVFLYPSAEGLNSLNDFRLFLLTGCEHELIGFNKALVCRGTIVRCLWIWASNLSHLHIRASGMEYKLCGRLGILGDLLIRMNPKLLNPKPYSRCRSRFPFLAVGFSSEDFCPNYFSRPKSNLAIKRVPFLG